MPVRFWYAGPYNLGDGGIGKRTSPFRDLRKPFSAKPGIKILRFFNLVSSNLTPPATYLKTHTANFLKKIIDDMIVNILLF